MVPGDPSAVNRRDPEHRHPPPNVQSPLTVNRSQSTSDGAPFGNRASKSFTSLYGLSRSRIQYSDQEHA